MEHKNNIYKFPTIETVSDDYLWWEDAFTDYELSKLRKIALGANNDAVIGSNLEKNKSYRSTKVSFLHEADENMWIYERLAHVVSSLNRDYYRFDLNGIAEGIQFGNYTDEEQGHYDWHVDRGRDGVVRKLSVILQLTDPAEYEGGELLLKTSADEIRVQKKLGLITVFPSWTLHKVTPVTKGSRQSMVAWVTGQPFR